jgi:hypothetical protein
MLLLFKCNVISVIREVNFLNRPAWIRTVDFVHNETISTKSRLRILLNLWLWVLLSFSNADYACSPLGRSLLHLTVLTPIIRSAYDCNYSIWYLSHRYCYLPYRGRVGTGLNVLSHTQTSFNSSTKSAGSSNGVSNTRCCRYSCMRSWWWVEITPETCRAVFKYK